MSCSAPVGGRVFVEWVGQPSARFCLSAVRFGSCEHFRPILFLDKMLLATSRGRIRRWRMARYYRVGALIAVSVTLLAVVPARRAAADDGTGPQTGPANRPTISAAVATRCPPVATTCPPLVSICVGEGDRLPAGADNLSAFQLVVLPRPLRVHRTPRTVRRRKLAAPRSRQAARRRRRIVRSPLRHGLRPNHGGRDADQLSGGADQVPC